MKTARSPLLGRSRGAMLVAALAAATLAGLPASGQTIPLSGSESASEIEKFCTGIADAARDRRYALQALELKKLQEDVDKRIAALEEKRKQYEDWMARREKFLALAQENVVKIYSAMKPDAAAERLAELNVQLAAGILMKMESRKAGVILNEMNSKAAAALTGIMASAARREDPT
ncbi:MAG: MotE family protein [Rhizobiaceae bacterium]|nr:MotE family protein [Rhizobiaceae bacterium]